MPRGVEGFHLGGGACNRDGVVNGGRVGDQSFRRSPSRDFRVAKGGVGNEGRGPGAEG